MQGSILGLTALVISVMLVGALLLGFIPANTMQMLQWLLLAIWLMLLAIALGLNAFAHGLLDRMSAQRKPEAD